MSTRRPNLEEIADFYQQSLSVNNNLGELKPEEIKSYIAKMESLLNIQEIKDNLDVGSLSKSLARITTQVEEYDKKYQFFKNQGKSHEDIVFGEGCNYLDLYEDPSDNKGDHLLLDTTDRFKRTLDFIYGPQLKILNELKTLKNDLQSKASDKENIPSHPKAFLPFMRSRAKVGALEVVDAIYKKILESSISSSVVDLGNIIKSVQSDFRKKGALNQFNDTIAHSPLRERLQKLKQIDVKSAIKTNRRP